MRRSAFVANTDLTRPRYAPPPHRLPAHTTTPLTWRVRGHATLVPVAQRAANPGLHGLVGNCIMEQTTCADDEMTEEKRRRAQRQGAADGRARAPRGADVPAGGGAGGRWIAGARIHHW